MAQIRAELGDSYQIDLSDDAIENSIQRYQTMLAAREQDPKVLAEEYRDVDDLVLCIDGLQPEKGYETLYVVRELRRKRVWFAESLIYSLVRQSTSADCPGPTMGSAIGSSCSSVDFGQTRGVCERHPEGIPWSTPSLLRQPFPAGSGQAAAGTG